MGRTKFVGTLPIAIPTHTPCKNFFCGKFIYIEVDCPLIQAQGKCMPFFLHKTATLALIKAQNWFAQPSCAHHYGPTIISPSTLIISY